CLSDWSSDVCSSDLVHDRALVIGVSRKSFLGKLIGSQEISDRLIPGVALTSLLRARGAEVFRVHDVRENVYALGVTEAVLQRARIGRASCREREEC